MEGCSGPPGPDDGLMITASEPNILRPDGSLEFPHSQTVPTGKGILYAQAKQSCDYWEKNNAKRLVIQLKECITPQLKWTLLKYHDTRKPC